MRCKQMCTVRYRGLNKKKWGGGGGGNSQEAPNC